MCEIWVLAIENVVNRDVTAHIYSGTTLYICNTASEQVFSIHNIFRMAVKQCGLNAQSLLPAYIISYAFQ